MQYRRLLDIESGLSVFQAVHYIIHPMFRQSDPGRKHIKPVILERRTACELRNRLNCNFVPSPSWFSTTVLD